MNALTGILFFLSLLLGVTIIRKRRRLAGKSKAPLNPPIEATASKYWVTFNSSQNLGMSIIESDIGCQVQEVMEGGQAQGKLVKPGHVVTKVGRTPVYKDTSLETVLALIEKEKTKSGQFIIYFRKP